MQTYEVFAHWDAEANVWWAESESVPGLVAEAETVEALLQDLKAVVPELLTLNGVIPTEHRVALRLVTDRVEDLHLS
ncbi:MAG: DUF1902 domain-containing protein [Acidisphaera sp.]|nr:DUF1902 domain-containing protein [Acidisphaera sp.]